jgi:hypothetical protein
VASNSPEREKGQSPIKLTRTAIVPAPAYRSRNEGLDPMPRFDRDQTHAISHPLRLRILEMHAHERWQRPISVEALAKTLVKTPGFEHVKPGEVNYHRVRLLDAELLPVE